jgi:hypothetical protein
MNGIEKSKRLQTWMPPELWEGMERRALETGTRTIGEYVRNVIKSDIAANTKTIEDYDPTA